ncbi:MAG: phasin family protein [Nitrospirae bacterium]|nr:phasin family protein [Nitrospirota bacterium]
MTLFEAVRNALLAGFGMQQKVNEFIDDLVKKGELSESQGVKLIKEWTEKAEKGTDHFTKNFSEIFTKTMEKMNLPTRDDIEKLNKKVQNLSGRVKKLEGVKEEGQAEGSLRREE